jgi:hypothetical protein
MDLHTLNKKILKGVSLEDGDFRNNALEALIKIYESGAEFKKSKLHGSDIDLDFISADMSNIASYMFTIGMAKSISKTLLENSQAVADRKLYDTDREYYKNSSKSSTIHTTNIRGMDEVRPFFQLYYLFNELYEDLNRLFEGLRSISSNRRFEIEKGLIDYTIRKKK